MARTIIVGDVHGCRKELERLLKRIGLRDEDRLVFVGDLVGRGPDTTGVLKLVRKLRAVVVRGNHEQKLLGYRTARLRGEHRKYHVSRTLRETAQRISPEVWSWLDSLPLWFDIPEHDLRIVHAGVVPGMPAEATDPNVLMTVRGLTHEGVPTSERSSRPWGEVYSGPPHVVFGHNAWIAPQIHPWATGIDTGCVYGGALTAMVLVPGEHVPSVDQRLSVLVSVPSERPYAPIRRDTSSHPRPG